MVPLRKMDIRSPKTTKEWEEYYFLRYTVLRKPLGQPIGSEKNEGDLTGKHFAFFLEKKIVAIARLDPIDSRISQIRFFAVDGKIQGKGFGKILLKEIEKSAKKRNTEKIILQSRENAVPFYENNGYFTIEKTHLLFGKVQHYLMEKEL